jgi:hypothetical protein
MDTIGRGVIAGFLATLALSAFLDPATSAARMADVLPPAFAWVLHFFVGGFIWGAGFALLQPLVRGPYWLRGLLFGVLAWLLVMLLVMPLARLGPFGLRLGLATPAIMLFVHVVHGTLLGAIFGALDPHEGGEELPPRPSSSLHDWLHPFHR